MLLCFFRIKAQIKKISSNVFVSYHTNYLRHPQPAKDPIDGENIKKLVFLVFQY